MTFFQLWVILGAIYLSQTMSHKGQQITGLGFLAAAAVALMVETFKAMG